MKWIPKIAMFLLVLCITLGLNGCGNTDASSISQSAEAEATVYPSIMEEYEEPQEELLEESQKELQEESMEEPQGEESSTNFFDDANRLAQYEEFRYSFQYSALLNLVNTYIEENTIAENDAIYEVKTLLEPLIPYEENWNITYDEFEDEYIWHYSGLDAISGDVHVVPKLTSTYGTATMDVGFQKDGWLFMDEYQINADGEKIMGATMNSSSVERNTLGGSTIEEIYHAKSCKMDEEKLAMLTGAESVVLRFYSSEDDNTLDFSLSQSECDGLYCAASIYSANSAMSWLSYPYRH